MQSNVLCNLGHLPSIEDSCCPTLAFKVVPQNSNKNVDKHCPSSARKKRPFGCCLSKPTRFSLRRTKMDKKTIMNVGPFLVMGVFS